MRQKMDYIQPTDPPKTGGKCPLELLQMTCASIGRESPKPVSESKKRKLNHQPQTSTSDCSSKPPESKISRKEIDSRSEKDESSTSKGTKTPEKSPEIGQTLKPVRSPVTTSRSAELVRPKSNGSNPERKTSIKTTPTISTTVPTTFGTPTTNLLNPSLLQSAELDRYLRASASLYSATTLQHPASALSQLYPSALGGSIPGLPGLLPQMPYMPFYTGYPQATLGLSAGMNALFPGLGAGAPTLHPSVAPGRGSTSASLTSESEEKIPQRTCDWANCGKKFASPEQLAEHVKEHVTNMPTTPATPPTPQSAKTSVTSGLAATTTNPMALPRFSPYNISSYPRDLLNSRFVYS